MSIKIMSEVWDKSKTKGAGLLLLLAIADHADENGLAWPGIDTLARKIRMTERHTRRIVASLEKAGELQVLERSGRANLYIVTAGITPAQQAAALARAEHLGGGDVRPISTPDILSGVLPVSGGDEMSGTPDIAVSDTPDIAVSDEPSLTINQSSSVVAGQPTEQQTALNALTGLGVEPATAERLARKCDAAQVMGWVDYARGARGLQSAPALVVARLTAGQAPPSRRASDRATTGDSGEDRRRRFIGGQYADCIKH